MTPAPRQLVSLDYLDSTGSSADLDSGAPWDWSPGSYGVHLPNEGNLTTSIPAATPCPPQLRAKNGRRYAEPEMHLPVIDLDFAAYCVPSRTVGHYHLYLDRPVPADVYWRLLDVMAEAGLVEPGYVASGRARGFTSVRTPGTFEPHSTTREELDAELHALTPERP